MLRLGMEYRMVVKLRQNTGSFSFHRMLNELLLTDMYYRFQEVTSSAAEMRYTNKENTMG